ncbi:MAG: GFA family protein [Pseudomonadota bacterium]
MEGHCHCQRVRWRMDKKPNSVSACNCTLCARYGVLWAYGYIDHNIHVDGPTRSYRRGGDSDGDIDFHFCAHCGCVTHYISNVAGDDGRFWSAVNMRLTELGPIADLKVYHFDGLNTFADLPDDGRCVADLWH